MLHINYLLHVLGLLAIIRYAYSLLAALLTSYIGPCLYSVHILCCWITGVVLTEINATEHISIFWDRTTCSLLKIKWHFGGTCHLHLQGKSISQATNERESKWQPEYILFVIFSPVGLLTALQLWTEQKELTWTGCLFFIGLAKQSAADSQITSSCKLILFIQYNKFYLCIRKTGNSLQTQ
jgi:hypothetical protein